MSFEQTLRPESTDERNRQKNELLSKGFYPMGSLPRDAILRVPNLKGPTLGVARNTAALPKIRGGVDDFTAHQNAVMYGPGTVCWCPVVFIVLYQMSLKRYKHKYLMGDFAQDITSIRSDKRRQVALLATFTMTQLDGHPEKVEMKTAIDNAIKLLTLELEREGTLPG